MEDNSQSIYGSYNIGIKDVQNSDIDIIIGKSSDYEQLLTELNELKEILNNSSEDNLEFRKKYIDKINQKEIQIERFKEEILRLAEMFSKLEINTERLIKARELFQEGKIREANEILNINDLRKDQTILFEAKIKKERELKEINEHLLNNSNEYLVKIQTIRVNYTPDKYREVFNLFKQSIKSNSNLYNNYEFAGFFMFNGYFKLAEPYYEEALKYTENVDPGVVCALYNNIGVCYKEQGKAKLAEKYFMLSISIREEFVDEGDPYKMLPYAQDLMNLGLLYADNGDFDNDLPFLEKALDIIRRYPVDSQYYLLLLSTALNNIGKHYISVEEFDRVEEYLLEAIDIRRDLNQGNPGIFTNKVAVLLSNLGTVYTKKEKYDEAQEAFLEAISLFDLYEKKKIFIYRPKFVEALIGSGILYTYINDKDMGIKLAQWAFDIARQINTRKEILMGWLENIRFIFNHFGEDFNFDPA